MTIEFAAHIWFSANDNNDQSRSRTVHIAGRTHKAQLRLEVIRFALWQAMNGDADA